MPNTVTAALKFASAMSLLLAVPVYAQSQATKDAGQETITVRPPYVVTKSTEGAFKDKRTSYSISRVVDYGDLDLKTDAGVSSLNGRVQEAANGVCHEMDNRFPEKTYEPAMKGDCATNAMAQARPQVDGAIKRARS